MHCETSICFNCMLSCRSMYITTRICPKCQREMITLSDRIRIPKRNRKLWDKFKIFLSNYNDYYKNKIVEILNEKW